MSDTNDVMLELRQRIDAAMKEHEARVAELWQAGDVIGAIRVQGVADGLELACGLQLGVAADMEAGRLDGQGRP